MEEEHRLVLWGAREDRQKELAFLEALPPGFVVRRVGGGDVDYWTKMIDGQWIKDDVRGTISDSEELFRFLDEMSTNSEIESLDFDWRAYLEEPPPVSEEDIAYVHKSLGTEGA